MLKQIKKYIMDLFYVEADKEIYNRPFFVEADKEIYDYFHCCTVHFDNIKINFTNKNTFY
jgi:hypothetical protein